MFSKFLPWIFVVGFVIAVAFVLVFVFLTYLESWNRDWILVTLTSVFWPPLRLPGVLSVSRGTIQVQVKVSVSSTRPSLQSSLSESRSSHLSWTKICASRWSGCPVTVLLMERWWFVGPGDIPQVGKMIASWQRSKLPLKLSLNKYLFFFFWISVKFFLLGNHRACLYHGCPHLPDQHLVLLQGLQNISKWSTASFYIQIFRSSTSTREQSSSGWVTWACLTLKYSNNMANDFFSSFPGRLKHGGARGPGLFFVLPYVDSYRKVLEIFSAFSYIDSYWGWIDIHRFNWNHGKS